MRRIGVFGLLAGRSGKREFSKAPKSEGRCFRSSAATRCAAKTHVFAYEVGLRFWGRRGVAGNVSFPGSEG